MNARRMQHLGLLSILLLVIAVSGWAQAVHDVTITGTATMASGEGVPGVTIRITSPALVTGERQVVSDSQGRFVFLSLPPGTFNLTAELQGFNTFSSPRIVLHAGDKTDVKVALRPSTVQEQITVTAVAPVLDTKTSEVSTTFSSEMLQRLPTARNAFYDLAMGAPGMASVGANESWLTSPSAYGSAANENIFLVNGVNATNPRGAPWGSLVQVNYNTVEEVKILSLGSKAEYGSFSGAAIDVITKSGGNEFNGDVAGYSQLGHAANNGTVNFGGRQNRFDQTSLFYAKCPEPVAPGCDASSLLMTKPITSREGSVTFGGPVLKDRLWFYTGYNKVRSTTDYPMKPRGLWDSWLFDLKLTGDFSQQHRAWLAYHREKSLAGNNTWGLGWDPNMVYDQHQKNDTWQAQYQWVINDRNLASAKYLGFRTNQAPNQGSNLPNPGFINWWKWTGTNSIGCCGNFPYVEAQKSKRNTFQADTTHYAARFLGEHEVKFGVQYTKSAGNWMGGYFQGYANRTYPYPYNTGPAKNWWWNCDASWCYGTKANPVFPMYTVKAYQHPWLTNRQAKSTGLFTDDTWTLNDRLTLNLGVRFDRMSARYGEGAIYEMPATPDDINHPTLLRTRKGTGDIFDFKTFSPRAGFAYMLTDDRKTVLRLHAGRYYAPMGVESLRRLGPDMMMEKREKSYYFLPVSAVDLNKNGIIDLSEVRNAYRLLVGRKPDKVFPAYLENPSWQLEVAPGTKSPYTDQFELSLQRQLGSDYAVEATGIHKNSKNFITLRPYDTGTGQLYEWESMPFTTFTNYKTKIWQVKPKDFTGDGKIDINDWKYVLSHTAYRASNLDNFDGHSVGRTFDGFQLVFTKRYSHRWQALAAMNLNRSNGIGPRVLDQNWYIDGPMVMDTPFGSTFNHFQNNIEGPSLMTPRFMAKLNGSYTIPVIETDFGMRWRFDTGRPFWPVQNLPAFASWMADIQPGVILTTDQADKIVATDPRHPDWTPSTSIIDLSFGKSFRATRGTNLWVAIDVLNAFNENSPNLVGFKQGDYGQVYSIISPRTFRLGVKVAF